MDIKKEILTHYDLVNHDMGDKKGKFYRTIFPDLSIEIRNKKITRNKALNLIKRKGFKLPIKEINKFCDFIGIDKKEFFNIVNLHRNKKIWSKKNTKWVIKNFLIKNWKW